MCLELIRLLKLRAQLDMVVDFAIDCEDYLSVGAHKRLSAGVCETGSIPLSRGCPVIHAPTPTIARRSCARIVCFPLSHPDQSGPR